MPEFEITVRCWTKERPRTQELEAALDELDGTYVILSIRHSDEEFLNATEAEFGG